VLHQSIVPTLAREGHDAVMKRMADLFMQFNSISRIEKDESEELA